MPNWCSTTFRFRGDRNELETLRNNILEWTSKEYETSGFHEMWLGNILHGAGLGDRIDNSDPNLLLRCRGSITDIGEIYDFNGFYFHIWTETAWVPMAKMWQAVINKLELKTVGFTFIAEESGCEIYWICDPNGYGDFEDYEVYIDAWDVPDQDDLCEIHTKADAIRGLQKFFKTNVCSFSKLKEMCEDYTDEHDGNEGINIHEYEIDNVIQD